ncbi:hypothetical protein [Hyalangium rubrum]|uniref:Lipoprotein n=1 Tax=Hyalangium rubrum TaxID=3103134 RepID=A0ABU5HET2_9BACT|nr:hypothetical protein [Hyalangium sp. s54d21]MDY7231866.1 hypothetical protein [Hyalangium sp. s54d21]
MKRGWRWAGSLVMASLVWTAGCTSSSGSDTSEQGNPGLDDPTPPEVLPPVVNPPATNPPVTNPPEQEAPPSNPPPSNPPPSNPPPTDPPPTENPPPPPPVVVPPPTTAGWEFYGVNEGGPSVVYGVTADEGGNVWVAGGEEGLFLLKPGATSFQRYTMTDGLRPYGYMADGSIPQGLPPYLKVISVAGGPAGTVFVGYEGQPGTGYDHCENNWDGPNPIPARYKSGDADKVTLLSDGTLNVVHYDIFSGPNVVGDEPQGREKLCNVLRIAYDKRTQSVWFGGNHGFARGDALFEGNPACNGQHSCAGLTEHVHPAINAYVYSHQSEDKVKYPDDKSKWRVRGALLTDAYYGVAVDPSGDAWFGGADRSTRFRYVSSSGDINKPNYWRAQVMSEGKEYAWNRYDVWTDTVGEPQMSRPEQRTGDHVSGIALTRDGSVWMGSFSNGLAQMTPEGVVKQRISAQLADRKGLVSAVAADPLDDSVWAGTYWGGGLSRVKGSTVAHYGVPVFGMDLTMSRVSDVQVDTSGDKRRILVGFMGYTRTSDNRWVAGSIGIYKGD